MRNLTVVTLILVLSLFYLEPASAEITIDGETLHVETDAYTVQFDRGVITHLHNKLTAEIYTLPPDANRSPGFRAQTGILGRKDVWARHAAMIDTRKISSHKAEILFRQSGSEIRLVIAVDPNTDDLLISGDCMSDTPGVIGMKWGCENLDLRNLKLILPAESGQIIDASSSISYKTLSYPGGWEAQLAILQGERGGFYVRGTDETFQFKELDYQSDAQAFGLGFQTHSQAPFDTLTSAKSVAWRLNTYIGDWRVPARIYRDWMETIFNPWRLSNMPAWVGDIGLVVMYGGLDTQVLDKLAELVNPTKTLIYTAGWRRDGHDVNYPDYTAKEDFGDFVKYAHQHGFRIMPHVNLVGLSPYHPLYPEFQQFHIRSPWGGTPIGWYLERTEEPYRHAWINLASSKFRNLLLQRFKQVWEKYKVDAFHLDISHLVVNDANGLIEGLNSAQGNVLMHKELAEAMPGVAFSGEHLHEVTFFRESFAQRWPSKSIPHPISAFLFSPYTHSYGYLGLPSLENDPPRYHTFLNSYESRGVLPTVLVRGLRELNGHLTQQMLSVARQWQQLGLRPDFESDWGPDTLFQYTTQTGETVTYQRTSTGSALILPNSGGYERVFGVTQVQTQRGVPHWRAYNGTVLLGLDPNKAYLLTDTPRDLTQAHINSLPEGVSLTETRVTENAALFRLEKTSSNENESTRINVGFFFPIEPIGSSDTLRSIGHGHYELEATLPKIIIFFFAHKEQVIPPYHLRETQYTAGLQFDSIFRLGSVWNSGNRTAAENPNGEHKPSIFAHPPTNGQTILQFPLHLPQSQELAFSFSMVLQDNPCSDGVLFQVLLNGQKRFEHLIEVADWVDMALPLSEFAGQPVLLELVTDPNGSNSCDWAHWADLLITAEESESNGDVNQDGIINVLDMIFVAQNFGQEPPSDSRADTNKDGVVNLLDLVFVAEHFSQDAAAPAQLDLIKSIPSTAKEIIAAQRALNELEAIPNKSQGVQLAIELLRHYLSVANQRVEETKLLPNYPNPFNPETWIPYQLSEGSTVTVKIYDVTGSLVRTIQVGHKPTGYYLTRDRAVYWDGCNQSGESVGSGVYFYTLITDDYTQTRRMVIVK